MAAKAIAVANGAALGTTPPAASLSAYASDEAGQVSLGSGTTPAAGVLCTLTLGGDGSFVGCGVPNVIVMPLNAATAALQLAASLDATAPYQTITVACAVAPAASVAAGTYAFSYHVLL